MRGWQAVFLRELAEQRRLYGLAFALGWLPILLALLPSVSGYSKADVRMMGAWLIFAIFGLVMPLILGASLFARDLAERRAGFYFARPIGAWALWLGKVAAAWLGVWLALSLVLLPTQVVRWVQGQGWLVDTAGVVLDRLWALPILTTAGPRAFSLVTDGSLGQTSSSGSNPAVALLVLPLFLILFAHTLAVIWRDRSAWLGLDLFGLVATLIGASWVARTLWQAQAIGALMRVQSFWSLWLGVALLVAGGIQLARGRADLLCNHRALAFVLWPLLLAGAVVPLAYARWVLTAGLADLEARTVAAAPVGNWLLIEGTARGRAGWRPSFLVSSVDGRTVTLGSQTAIFGGLELSSDGRVAVWTDCRALRSSTCELKWLALTEPGAEPQATGIEAWGSWNPFALAEDGSRIALCQGAGTLSVYELPAVKLIASTRLELGAFSCPELSFASKEIVRFHLPAPRHETGGATTWHFDLAHRELRKVAEHEAPWVRFESSDPYRGLVLDASSRPTTFWLKDAITEEVRWSYQPSTEVVIWKRFLADGRLVWSARTQAGVQVVVLTATGELERQLVLEGVAEVIFGYELAPGRLALGISNVPIETWPVPQGEVHWRTELLDVATGEREKALEGARPVMTIGPQQPRLGAEATRLFMADDGEVFRWDPATGERRVVLAREV